MCAVQAIKVLMHFTDACTSPSGNLGLRSTVEPEPMASIVWTHVVSVHQELWNFTLRSVMDGKSYQFLATLF
jgi:hypothetical protein